MHAACQEDQRRLKSLSLEGLKATMTLVKGNGDIQVLIPTRKGVKIWNRKPNEMPGADNQSCFEELNERALLSAFFREREGDKAL